jgi:sugar lactone lactonase YvrE
MRQILPPVRGVLRNLSILCARLAAAIVVTAIAAQAQTVATTLPLLFPWAIVFDSQGNLYFAETNNHVIREVTPAGLLTTVAGTGVQGFSGDGGAATSAELDSPAGLALDSAGNLYVADTHNQRIRRITLATGLISTVAGSGVAGFAGDGGPAGTALLDHPTALALDSAGNLYIADTGNHRIRKLGAATGILTTVAGDGVQSFSGDNGPATAASIDSPRGIALDSAGNLYLADTHNQRVRKVGALTGAISTIAGVSGATSAPQPFGGDNGPDAMATLALPRGLALDAAGDVYLADTANQRIRVLSASTGAISTLAGQGTETFAGDGAPAVSASLDSPRAVALSPAGLLTLADTGNARVRQLDALPAPGPDIHTIAGIGVAVSTNPAPTPTPTPTASDFTLTATGATTLAIPPASTGTFTFSVGIVGAALASPIALAVTGVPAGVTASLNPTYLPPGGTVTSFTLAITTPAVVLAEPSPTFGSHSSPQILLSLLVLPVIAFSRRECRRCAQREAAEKIAAAVASRRERVPAAKAPVDSGLVMPGLKSRPISEASLSAACLAAVCAIFCAALVSGCGNRVNTGAVLTNSSTYTLTVTGTATSMTGTALQHSATVTLQLIQ